MKLFALIVVSILTLGGECPRSTPVGSWKLVRHGDGENMLYDLTESEKSRVLTFDDCHNFWIVQSTDTVEYGKWRLTKKGTRLSLKFELGSTKITKTATTLHTPYCFEDSLVIGEDLPGRTYADPYTLRESTYFRIKD